MASLLLVAGRVGVDHLLLRGLDDLARGIREVLTSPPSESDVNDAVATMALPSGPAVSTVAHCLRRAMAGPLTVQQLADQLQISRKTVGVWLRDAGLPAPEQLIGWCRVYGVARLLADPRRSVAQVARVLNFSSESDLRRMVSRYLGCTPTQLRDGGGVSLVTAALRDRRIPRQH
jgi:AraC-like DNA-binding protein